MDCRYAPRLNRHDVSPIAMPKRFPEFAVESIVDAECIGKVEPSKWAGEGWIVGLRVGDRFIWGRFVQVDKTTGAARVRFDEAADIAALKPSASYAFIDGYWGGQAELVLDRSRAWHRETFRPLDAVQYAGDGQRLLTQASPDKEGGTLVPGGWDHEHCELCNQTISEHGPSVGWTNAKGEWLCEVCYETYLVPRSIEFVNVE